MYRYLETSKLHVVNEPPQEVRTVSETIHLEDDLSIDIAVADGRRNENDPTTLFFLPWSEYVTRQDAADRQSMLAHAMCSRVVAVGNAGVGPNAGMFPASMKEDIKNGNFQSLAQAQIETLRKSDHDIRLHDGVSIMGYSLGTTIAARFVRELDDSAAINSLTFLEPVGMTPQSSASLVSKFAKETMAWGSVYSETKQIHPEWMARPGLSAEPLKYMCKNLFYFSYIQGLSKAPMLVDLEVAREANALRPSTPIRIVNGSKSVISTSKENDGLANSLQGYGFQDVEHDIYIGESHGVIDVPRKLASIILDGQREFSVR